MRNAMKFMGCIAAISLLSACGTTAPKKRTTSGPQINGGEPRTDDPEEDLETVFVQAEIKAPEYIEGVEHEAQDAFRQGTQLVHEDDPDYDRALELFEKAIEIDKDFLEPYFNIAMVHERRGEPTKALNTYKRALKANPDNDDATAFIGKIYLARARRLRDNGQPAKALILMAQGKRIFDEVLARSYENVPANNALALYWLLKSDGEKAEDHVKMVLTIEPDNVTALNTRGLIFLQKGELDFAKWIFEQKVLGIDKNSIEAHTNLGIVYTRLKNASECGSGGCLPRAVKHFGQAVRLDKSNVPARMNLGAIFIDFLNYPAALVEYEKVLEIQPDNVEAVIGLGSATLGMGNMTDAIKLWEKALEMDKRRTVLLFRIGSLIEKAEGGTEEGLGRAIVYYERYVKAASLPADHQLVRKIPVLKEVITSGMLRMPPPGSDEEVDEPKSPAGEGGEGAEGGDGAAGSDEPGDKAPEAKPAEGADEKKPEATPAEGADEKKPEAAPAEGGQKKPEAAPAEGGEKKPEAAPAEGGK